MIVVREALEAKSLGNITAVNGLCPHSKTRNITRLQGLLFVLSSFQISLDRSTEPRRISTLRATIKPYASDIFAETPRYFRTGLLQLIKYIINPNRPFTRQQGSLVKMRQALQ